MRNLHLYLVLLVMGATWGVTPVLMKTIVSTGYKPFGIVLWSTVISAVLSGLATYGRGRGLRISRRHFGLYLGISLIGAIVPNYFSYTGIAHLPAGIMAIIIALVPMFAMPIALLLGFEKPSAIRFMGTFLGALAIVLIVAPSTALPDSSKIIYVFIAMLAPLCYGAEGNFLVWYGARGLDPFQILFGASLVGVVIMLPLTFATGQYISPIKPWTAPEWAIVATAVISWGTYATYIWLIGKAGPVFSSQVAYTVTGFGVVWSMVLLNERYSIWVWAAFVLILIGVLLVQPRKTE